MLKKGKYQAVVTNAGKSQSSAGNPQVFMEFEVTLEDGAKEPITWFGGLSDKAIKFTAKALYNAGFLGSAADDLDKPFITVFAPKKVQLDVQERIYNGKTMTEVKWVNELKTGPKKFVGSVPNTAAAFAEVRQELGLKKAVPNMAPKAAASDDWT